MGPAAAAETGSLYRGCRYPVRGTLREKGNLSRRYGYSGAVRRMYPTYVKIFVSNTVELVLAIVNFCIPLHGFPYYSSGW